MARFYHKIDDITLPWSIGLAPLDKNDDSNELESSAIRKFAPIFNTSIPSKLKSKGKEPKIIHLPDFIFKLMMRVNILQSILNRIYGNFNVSSKKFKNTFGL